MIIFNGQFNGTRADITIIKSKIMELNAFCGFIRVEFMMSRNDYFSSETKIYKCVARINADNTFGFYKTTKGGRSLNINSCIIKNIKLLPFSKNDKIKFETGRGN